jgi:hypothetical protein
MIHQLGTYIAAYKKYKMKRDVNQESFAFHMPMFAVYEKYEMTRDVNREPITFCTQCCACKSIRDDKGHQSGASCFLYVTLRV